jgi:hypothetical protein
MDGYRLVLFLHLCAMLGAIGTAALLHFAEIELRAATTVAAVRTWVSLIAKGAKVLPLALLVLLGSGADLVERGWTWSPALAGSLVALAVATVLGAIVALRLRRIGRRRV